MRLMFDTARSKSILIAAMCITGTILSAQQTPTVPTMYSFLYSMPFDGAQVKAAQRDLPFTSISITHSGCFGPCPIYTATINLDGSATYEGKENVLRVGRFSGSVDLRDFAQLCLFIERAGFMNLADRYAAPWTDDETVMVRVTRRDGGTKTVINYGSFAPPEAWTLQHAIDGVVARVRWERARAGR